MVRALILLRDCENCGASEERVFVDSWTGMELCASCLSPIIGALACSPASDGDNLNELLRRRT